MSTLIPDHPFRSPATAGAEAVYLVDETLTTRQAGSCDLLVLLDAGSLRIALQERKTRRFLALESVPFPAASLPNPVTQFRDATTSSRMLREYEFSKCTIGFSNSFYTLVPNGLFQTGDEQSLLRFTQSRGDLQAFRERLQGFDTTLVFGIEPELRKMAEHLFQQPTLLHAVGGGLERLNLDAASSRQPLLAINLRDGEVDIGAASGKKLLLQNTFPIRSADEVLYYVLFVIERLELDTDGVAIVVSGQFDPRGGTFTRLREHLPQTEAADWPGYFVTSYKLKDQPAHRHLDLYSLSLCAS